MAPAIVCLLAAIICISVVRRARRQRRDQINPTGLDTPDPIDQTGLEFNQADATALGLFEAMTHSAPPVIDQAPAAPSIDMPSHSSPAPGFSSAASTPSFDCGSTYSDSGGSVDSTC